MLSTPTSTVRETGQGTLCRQGSKGLQVDSEGPDQLAQMRKLIWVFAGRTCIIVGNSVPGLNCWYTELCATNQTLYILFAVCYKEANPEQLGAFIDDVEQEGRLTGDTKDLLEKLDEDPKEKEEKKSTVLIYDYLGQKVGAWWDGGWQFSTFITKTRLFKYIENITSKNWKFSDKKLWYFSHFCSNHRLWVLFRTASPRRF